MSQWNELRDRLDGKWQLPLLLLSLGALGFSVFRLIPAPAQRPISLVVEILDDQIADQLFERAIVLGSEVLTREEVTEVSLAPIVLRLARARYGWVEQHSAQSASAGRRIVADYQAAASHGLALDRTDRIQLGYAFEWQGRYSDAVGSFESVLEGEADGDRDLRQHVLSLKLDRLALHPAVALRELEEFADGLVPARLDLAIWTIERRLDALDDLGRLSEVSTLLARNRKHFVETIYRNRFAYLEAWLLYRDGHFDEVEARLRAVRNGLDPADETYAMTGWLLGRVILDDGGPQRPLEAVSFFRDVLNHHPDNPYGVASRIGFAEAMAMLERHPESLEAYRVALDQLEFMGDRRLVHHGALRASLGLAATIQQENGHLHEAVAYAKLAAKVIGSVDTDQRTLILERLAQLQFQLASSLDTVPADLGAGPGPVREGSTEEARDAFTETAETYISIAQANATSNEERSADAAWRAAEMLARAGARDRAISMYRVFAKERSRHRFVPRSFLRVGQLAQIAGRLDQAIEAYQECYRRFPLTLDGSRSLVPLAQCYLLKGGDGPKLAEATLSVVLEDAEVFTPNAPEFAEALFMMGETLKREGEFERAIAILDEAIERYGEDPRYATGSWVRRSRFLLADSYRQSALALKNDLSEIKAAGAIQQIRDEYRNRFSIARELFHGIIQEHEQASMESLTALERTTFRLSHLYEADCYFETQEYRRALKLYEEAAGLYKDSSSSLSAYVQMINSHVFLGEPAEARAALARAMVLVSTIPQEAFTGALSLESREDWKNYFEWLSESNLF